MRVNTPTGFLIAVGVSLATLAVLFRFAPTILQAIMGPVPRAPNATNAGSVTGGS